MALYQSLEKVCPSFHLYVFAFDDDCYTYLKNYPLPNLTVISLREFEYAVLLKVKPSRSMAEYCWTSTPFTILFCLENFHLPHCTYLDADLIFYNDPQVLIDEMGDKSVLISEHRYPNIYDQSWYSGIYCVQFMCFKNNEAGLEVLNWWKDRCIEWCYGRLEDGKFGDQKYLDDWRTRFDSVHVMQHRGGGVAPWNLLLYSFIQEPGLKLIEKKTRLTYDVIFFHFHGVQFFTDNKVSLAGPLYEISSSIKKLFYYPYVNNLLEIASGIRQQQPLLNANGALKVTPPVHKVFIEFARGLLNSFTRYFPAAFHLKNYNFKKHNHVHSLKSNVQSLKLESYL
ncbi:MAG: hypothetical protein ABIN89_31395 [Chitinophagaceae bacterium]